MKNRYLKLAGFLAALLVICCGFSLNGQTTVSTSGFTNNNGSSVVTFNFVNNNAFPVMITDVASIAGANGSNTAQLWYKPGAIAGPPGSITTGNGWTMASSNTFTMIANTTTTTTQPMMTGVNLTIPASSTYGLCFSLTGGSLRYSTIAAGTYTFSGGGCDIVTGTNIGYGGTLASPVNTPRGFLGSITFVPVAPCSGMPAPGNTMSSANPVCPNANFTLSLQNSQGTGTTYQWQSSPDGLTWTNIAAATNSSLITNTTVATYYQCIVTCTNSSMTATSTPLLVNVAFTSACYCTSAATTTADEEIFNVTVGTLNNSSTCASLGTGPGSILNRYSNYSSGAGAPAAPVLMQGSTVATSLNISSCGSFNYTSGAAIFIDYNMDGDFLDPGEQVWNNGTSANINCVPASIVPGSFTVPLTATPGTTLMRVIDAEGYAGSTITPCLATYGYGETEDYLVTIAAATACAGMPSPGPTSATAMTVCPNGTTVLSLPSLPAATGYTFQWQSSPDGLTWTNIVGANSASYTATLTATTYYQCIVTCTNSSLSANSTPVMVTVGMSISCYCTSYATTTADEEITNVTMSNLNNSSTCASTGTGTGSIQNRYSNYTSGPGAPAAVNLTQQVAASFSVTVGSCGSFNYTSGLAIFIDLNMDGDFLDAGEKVYTNGAAANINCVPASVISGSITIPLSATPGQTYMRIIDAEGYAGDAITPCMNTYGYGETEDYLVNIVAPPPQDLLPAAMVRPLTTGCYTASDSVIVSITNNGTAAADFTVAPMTVSCSVTGPNPTTFTPVVVSTGTLAPLATMNVVISSTYNMSAAGTYGFTTTISSIQDGNPTNNTLGPVNFTFSPGIATAGGGGHVCQGGPANVSVAGVSPATASIQWQSSTDNVTWTNIPGQTSATCTAPAMDTTFYRAMICGLISSNSDTVFTIFVAPAVATNDTVCGFGTPTLTATGTGTLQWFDAQTAGTLIDTGMAITPTVTATDTFWVESTFRDCGAAGTPTAPTCYPTYSSACSSSDYINNFSTTGGSTNISNLNSGCNGSSPTNTTFFPSQVVTVAPGTSFNFSIQSGLTFGQGHHIWIDYNNDGDFTDPGEDVWSSPSSSTAVYTGTVNVPSNVTAGPKRIRVMCRYATVPTAGDVCGSSLSFGEVEEYTLNVCTLCSSVRVPAIAVVSPAPGITVASASTSLCNGDSTLISVSSGNSNYDYTWSPSTFLNTTSGDSVYFHPTTPGSYSFEVTANDSTTGCAFRDTINMSMSNRPTFTLATTDDSICGNTQTQLNVVLPSSVVQISNSNVLNTSTTYPAPYGNWYGGARHQMLIRASELTAAGMTAGFYNGMTFQVTNTNASAPLMNFTISMGLTSVNALTTTFETSPMTMVYTNASYAPTVGVNAHTFSTPFYWDGTSNIIVETCFLNQTGPTTTSYTNNCTMRQVATAYASTNVYWADNDINACSAATGWSTYNQRPNMGFMRSMSSWTYAWSPVATLSDPTNDTTYAMPLMTTNYMMTVTDTVSGCATMDTIQIYVLPTPYPNFGPDTVICSNTPMVLDGGAGNYTYLWQDNSTSQTYTVSAFGNYDVVVTDTLSGCSGTDTVLVGVNIAPSFTLGSDVTVCAGTQVSFSGPSGQYGYMWNTGDTVVTIMTGTAGSYDLAVTDTINGCIGRDTVALMVNPLPAVALGSDTSVCSANGAITLSAPAGNYSYDWSTLDSTQTIAVNSTGVYSVLVTDTTTSCYSSDTIMVTYNTSPVANLGSDTTFCSANGPITLMGPAGPYAYMWSDNSTGMTLQTNTTGTYIIDVTDTTSGCTASDTIMVNVPATPSFAINDTSICGSQLTLNGPAGPFNYLWSDNTTGMSTTVTSSGTYSLTVTDSTSGCASTDAAVVNINTNPTVTATASSMSPCADDANVILTGSPAGGTFTGTSVTGNQFDPSIGAGTYAIIYNFTDPNGCSGADTVNINVNACVGIDEPFVQAGMNVYPNPNNGVFTFTAADQNCQKMIIEIVTVEGKVIQSTEYANVQGNFVQEINLNSLANGTYIMRVTTDGAVYTQRIVKQD